MEIKFNKEIYSLGAVKLAIKEFSELADIDIEQEQNYIRVKFIKVKEGDMAEMKDEFANYVLGLHS